MSDGTGSSGDGPDEALLYLDGGRVEARSGERFPTLNPATGEVLAQVHHADDADVSVE